MLRFEQEMLRFSEYWLRFVLESKDNIAVKHCGAVDLGDWVRCDLHKGHSGCPLSAWVLFNGSGNLAERRDSLCRQWINPITTGVDFLDNQGIKR